MRTTHSIIDLIRNPSDYFNVFTNFIVFALIIYLFFSLEPLIERWQRLSIRVRWIFCWPMILILFFLTNFLSMIMAKTVLGLTLRSFGNSERVIDFLSPLMSGLIAIPILYFIVFCLIPRKQHWLMGLWLVISALLLGISFLTGLKDKTLGFGEGLQSFMYLLNLNIGFNYYKRRLTAGLSIKSSPYNYYFSIIKRDEN